MAKIVRLKESGAFEQGDGTYSGLARLDKPAMLVYCGKFESMDGPVEIKDEDIELLASNHNAVLAKLSRMATGEHHPKHNPPVQLDHSTSARDTVGRLIGNLTVGDYEKDGVKLKALFGKPRILGKENVEKVEDGRWVHLSGGFDLENHTVSELTITPFPAAADAAMLSRRMAKDPGSEVIEEGTYKNCVYLVYYDEHDRVVWEAVGQAGISANPGAGERDAKKAIDKWIASDPEGHRGGRFSKATKLSSGEDTMGYKEVKEKADMYAKCKKHLTEHKKMSDEDADKHLEAAKDEELKKMSADEDEREKKLAAEKAEADKKAADEKEAELKRMSALGETRAKIVELSKGLRATGAKTHLAARKAAIDTRLSRLQSEAKISPAERKGIDLTKLAAGSDEAVEAALTSYEKREPVIDVGQLGSTKAATAAQLRRKVKAMGSEVEELRTRLRMQGKRDGALKRLSELGLTEADLEKGVPVQIDGHEDPNHDVDMEAAYGTLKKLWGEGKEDEAKQHFKRCYTVGPDTTMSENVVGPDQPKQMSALAAEVKSMQSSFDEVMKLAAPALGIKPEDLQ